MKNKKGQALVEFIIILPVFILLVFAVIDFGKIIYTMNVLEGINNEIVYLYKDGKSESEINAFIEKEKKGVIFKTSIEENMTELKLSTEVEIITPGLGLILSNPYNVETSRVVYNE